MKEDILKFRKLCDILLKDKGYSKSSICKEIGISEPTLQKLLTAELDSFNRDGSSGMRASTLGIIQDFNKKHCNDLNYAGIKPAAIIEVDKKVDTEKLKKNLSNYKEPEKKVEEKIKEGLKRTGEAFMKEARRLEFKGSEYVPHLEITGKPYNAFDSFLEALKSVPSNVTIHISVNEK